MAETVLAVGHTRLGEDQRPSGIPSDDPKPVPEYATAVDGLAAFLGRKVAG